MPVYLDVSAAVHRRAGLGRYAESLARALVARGSRSYALFYNRERGVAPLPGLEHLPTRTIALGYKPWRMLVWLGHLAHIGFDGLLPDAALFHATEHLLLPLQEIPTVLTVHDLIFRYLPHHHKPLNRWYLNLAMPLYCRRASHIIAISNHTQRDLTTIYNIPSQKITVIHEAADPVFQPSSLEKIAAVRRRYSLPERYLLFVGTIEPRKNLSRLLEAFERVLAEGMTDGLVVVGRCGWLYEEFFTRLESSPARARVLLPGFVPDDDLAVVYTGAQALVFPSLYEGFGLPVLEAMACGTPVVCSNTSSLPEVAGEAALLVDPRDACALADAMKQVLLEESVRETLRARGLARAGEFSWVRTARETLRVYRDDRFHPPAREAWEEQLSGGAILITSSYVVLETTALLQDRIGMEAVAPSHKMTTIFETTIS